MMAEPDTDEWLQRGAPMPRISRVRAHAPYRVEVRWSAGQRSGSTDVVDLRPLVFRLRAFSRLRTEPELFGEAKLARNGTVLVWPAAGVEMAAVTVERLAAEGMTNRDFVRFLQRNRLTLDSAAAAFGLSRRQIAYFTSSKPIPRWLAFACRGYEASERLDAA